MLGHSRASGSRATFSRPQAASDRRRVATLTIQSQSPPHFIHPLRAHPPTSIAHDTDIITVNPRPLPRQQTAARSISDGAGRSDGAGVRRRSSRACVRRLERLPLHHRIDCREVYRHLLLLLPWPTTCRRRRRSRLQIPTRRHTKALPRRILVTSRNHRQSVSAYHQILGHRPTEVLCTRSRLYMATHMAHRHKCLLRIARRRTLLRPSRAHSIHRKPIHHLRHGRVNSSSPNSRDRLRAVHSRPARR